ncbi:MAG: MoaD/ThiS family protein [Microthrixaceae bacterium]
MPVLRMFALARERAGTGEAEIDGATVGEVLDNASERFGLGFAELLPNCAIWVDGTPSGPSTTVGPTSEVAVLPPVSGGS